LNLHPKPRTSNPRANTLRAAVDAHNAEAAKYGKECVVYPPGYVEFEAPAPLTQSMPKHMTRKPNGAIRVRISGGGVTQRSVGSFDTVTAAVSAYNVEAVILGIPLHPDTPVAHTPADLPPPLRSKP